LKTETPLLGGDRGVGILVPQRKIIGVILKKGPLKWGIL
jgi:hypothetical protein